MAVDTTRVKGLSGLHLTLSINQISERYTNKTLHVCVTHSRLNTAVPVLLIDMLEPTVRDSLLADTRYKEPRIQHMLLPLQRCRGDGCL